MDARPSTVTPPELIPDGMTTIFDFFVHRFPRVESETWRQRFASGKVWSRDGPVDLHAPYWPLLELH